MKVNQRSLWVLTHIPGIGWRLPLPNGEAISKGQVTNYGEGGGVTKLKGAACEVLPLRKGGGGVLAMPKGVHKMFWRSFYAVVLAILKGGGSAKSFHSL